MAAPADPKPGSPTATQAPPAPASGLRPVIEVRGRVVMLNAQARFVVIDFGYGPAPQQEQRLGVYRGLDRVGTVRVTGTPRGTLYAADILEGEALVRDEVGED